MFDEYLKLILQARVYDVAQETPLDYAPELSRRFGNEIWLKREDLQSVFSYKVRGAYNLIVALTPEQRERGVIAASAGNHAQGVALAARHLGIKALIVMPKTTPPIKVAAVRRLGAEIITHGNSYNEAAVHADKLAQGRGMIAVPPFDHPLVIAGQGTVAMEILRQYQSRLEAIFVPVGGGGLIAGVGAYVKQISPSVKIIGVEHDEAPTMYTALASGERVVLEQVGIFADGAAVRQVGEETFRVARECVDEVLLVTTDEICAAIKDTFEDTRSVLEPAGALALAGLKQYVVQQALSGKNMVAICSGANVNFDRLRHIAELAELGEQREALLAVTIPERPGSFEALCRALGARQITEFNYRYANSADAQVFVGVKLRRGTEDRYTLLEQLDAKGYSVVDISDNEMAKLHIRYMVGGQTGAVMNEIIYRFEFPERPGALPHFLAELGGRWNISLFHYRNHGAAYGRVLAGIQVPDAERAEVEGMLGKLGMPFWDETENPAYQIFLG